MTMIEERPAAAPENKTRKVSFSGVQPTGNLHIGNYLGAIRNWVRDQDQYDNIYCIVDLHAITIQQEPKALHAATRELATYFLAAGLDLDKTNIFVQSHVREHTELAWVFNCVTPLGWMQKMTQYKEKSATQRESASLGLLAYPTLMAADILLYHTDVVPVGEDQKQHVELTRNIAQKFNHDYGTTFTLPEPVIQPVGARIMGLDEPTKKMSKSAAGKNHAIYLADNADAIRSKIMRATTDTGAGVIYDETNKPGIANLMQIYMLFTGQTQAQVEADFAGKGYGDFKKAVAEATVEGLRPLQTRYAELSADPQYIESVLKRGADTVRPVAARTVTIAKERMGLG